MNMNRTKSIGRAQTHHAASSSRFRRIDGRLVIGFTANERRTRFCAEALHGQV